MQRATLCNSGGSETASQLQNRIARAFSCNSLVITIDMNAAIQYIFTAAQSLGSQVYYKKSRMTILGLAGCIVLQKQAGIDKMDYQMFRRKYLLGCSGKLGEILQ